MCFYYYIGVVMRRSVSATFSMSQRGVDVAPHIPMDGTDFSHAGSMSSGPEMKWDAGFTSRHCSKRAFPLLLLRPDTKRMRLWDAANARMRGRRPATRRHIVSKYRNWPEVLRRCISWMTCWNPARLLVVWEYRSMSRERSTRSMSEVPCMTIAVPSVCPTRPFTSACPGFPYMRMSGGDGRWRVVS